MINRSGGSAPSGNRFWEMPSPAEMLIGIERSIGALKHGQEMIVNEQRHGFDTVHAKIDRVAMRVVRLEERKCRECANGATPPSAISPPPLSLREAIGLALMAGAGLAGLLGPGEVKAIALSLIGAGR
jgi:hypothetical protein